MKGIKSFCHHLEKPCAFALHSSPTKIIYSALLPRKSYYDFFSYVDLLCKNTKNTLKLMTYVRVYYSNLFEFNTLMVKVIIKIFIDTN